MTKFMWAVGLVLAFLHFCGIAQAETLVIAGWGGPYEKELRKTFFPAFEKKYDVSIEWLSASSFQNYGRIKAQRSNPQVDVVMLDDIVLDVARREGLIARLDKSIVKNLNNVAADARVKDDMGVGIGYNVVSTYYNTKIFKEKGIPEPTSWNDLFRPELKKRVVIRHMTSSYGLFPLLMFAKMNGGGEKNIDPGFAKMKELAPNVISFPTSNGAQAQMTLREEAWIGVTGLGEFQELLDKGATVRFFIPKEGTIAAIGTAAVVEGAPHDVLAQQFINEILSPEGQRWMAIALSWKPTSTKAIIDDEVKRRLPLDFNAPMNLKPVDFETVMENRDRWTERFNKEIAAK